jgi:S-formylglutathione hydrolase FrmB
MADGYRYFDFVADELPRICRSFFKLSEKRDDTFIAGLSMGGYGAMKIGLTYPERFSAVGSFSGVLDVSHYSDLALGQNRARAREMERIFGDVEALPNSEHDPMALATRLASSSGPRPRIYQCCGTEDFLYEGNKAFRDHVRALDLDFEYSEESATHDWAYWDRKVQDFLSFALGSN